VRKGPFPLPIDDHGSTDRALSRDPVTVSAVPLIEYGTVEAGDPEDLARIVLERRHRLGISQAQVVTRAGTLGRETLSVSTISAIERGTRGRVRGHKRSTILLLARGLDMRPDELMGAAGLPARQGDKEQGEWTFAEFVGQDGRLDEDGKRLLIYLYRTITGERRG
jgi:transcriptional regulator with XRE-family HTH domain